MKERSLSEIWIYPIKSLGGIQVMSANVMPKGLEHDRRWMLLNEDGNFMTQRDYPKMSLFKLTLGQEHIHISYTEHTLKIPFSISSSKQTITKVWDDTITAVLAEDMYSNWFSELLGIKCTLVHFPEGNPRPVDPRYKINDEHVSLADGYPFLIIGQASLDDLNNRLSKPLPMNRFRPNFVFTGGDPYEEDTWGKFAIGKNKFIGVKPCSRCVMTTVDQDTMSFP